MPGENHVAANALYFMHCNFARVPQRWPLAWRIMRGDLRKSCGFWTCVLNLEELLEEDRLSGYKLGCFASLSLTCD